MKKVVLIISILFLLMADIGFAASNLEQAYWLKDFKEIRRFVKAGERMEFSTPEDIIRCKERIIGELILEEAMEIDMMLRDTTEIASGNTEQKFQDYTTLYIKTEFFSLAKNNKGKYYFYSSLLDAGANAYGLQRIVNKIELYSGSEKISKDSFMSLVTSSSASLKKLIDEKNYIVYNLNNDFYVKTPEEEYFLLSKKIKSETANGYLKTFINISDFIQYLGKGKILED